MDRVVDLQGAGITGDYGDTPVFTFSPIALWQDQHRPQALPRHLRNHQKPVALSRTHRQNPYRHKCPQTTIEDILTYVAPTQFSTSPSHSISGAIRHSGSR